MEDFLVAPHVVLATMCRAASQNRKSVSFLHQLKTLQGLKDSKFRRKNPEFPAIASSIIDQYVPTLSSKHMNSDIFMMSCRNDDEALVIFEQTMELSEQQEHLREQNRSHWKMMKNYQHITPEVRNQLGLLPTTASMLFIDRVSQPYVADVVREPVAVAIVCDRQTSNLEDDMDENSVFESGTAEGIEVETVAPQMESVVLADVTEITEMELSLVGNELQLPPDIVQDLQQFMIKTVEPEQPPVRKEQGRCPLESAYRWRRSCKSSERESFAGIEMRWIDTLSMTDRQMVRFVLYVWEPARLTNADASAVAELINRHGPRMQEAQLSIEVLRERNMENGHIAIWSELLVARILYSPRKSWDPEAIHVADFAIKMITGVGYVRQHGGDQTVDQPSTWGRFKNYLKKQWGQLTESPTAQETKYHVFQSEDVAELASNLDQITTTDSNNVLSTLSRAGEGLKHGAGVLKEQFRALGQKAKAQMKKIAEYLSDDDPSNDEEARVALGKIRRQINEFKRKLLDVDATVQADNSVLLSQAESALDNLSRDLDKLSMSTQVLDEDIQMAQTTASHMGEDEALHSERGQLVSETAYLSNQLLWFLYGGEQNKYYNPKQVHEFASFVGSIATDVDLDEVGYLSSLHAINTRQMLGSMSKDDAYEYMYAQVKTMDQLLSESYKRGETLTATLKRNYEENNLTNRQIRELLGFMKYLRDISDQPLNGKYESPASMRDTGGNKTEEQRQSTRTVGHLLQKLPLDSLTEALLVVYQENIALQISDDDKQIVSAHRLADAIQVNLNLLVIVSDSTQRKKLLEERRLYLAIFYKNPAVMQYYMEKLLANWFREYDESETSEEENYYGSSSVSSYSSSSSSSESDEDAFSDVLESDGGDSAAVVDALQLVQQLDDEDETVPVAVSTKSHRPCALTRHRRWGHFCGAKISHIIALSQQLDKCHDWHDAAHCLSDLGISTSHVVSFCGM